MSTKFCKWCKKEKDLLEFHKHSGMKDGRLNKCSTCVVEAVDRWRGQNPGCRQKEYLKSKQFKNRKYSHIHPNPNWTDEDRRKNRLTSLKKCEQKRRSNLINATPSWYDEQEVDYIYRLATKKGLVVDHIVPLNSDKVCGLNVQDNMRCIPNSLNCYKGNRYWPNMPKNIAGY